MYHDEKPPTEWCKSSYSGGGNDCVEITAGVPGTGLRDSKDAASGALWLTTEAWRALRRTAGSHG